MYIYTVEAMRGQKAEDGTPVKYQVKRVNDSIPKLKKGRSEVIRENLDYDEAIALINGFNNKEGKSLDLRAEAARKKEQGG